MSSNTYTTSGLSQVTVDQFSLHGSNPKYFIQMTSGTRYHVTGVKVIIVRMHIYRSLVQ
jgi:hypothetical protein